jgi:hypothetical protein
LRVGHVAFDGGFFSESDFVVTKAIERPIARNLEQPCLGMFGNAAEGPLLHGSHQRILHGVFGEGKVSRPEQARQGRDHLSRLAPEQMIN